jgi:hypothetical protein
VRTTATHFRPPSWGGWAGRALGVLPGPPRSWSWPRPLGISSCEAAFCPGIQWTLQVQWYTGENLALKDTYDIVIGGYSCTEKHRILGYTSCKSIYRNPVFQRIFPIHEEWGGIQHLEKWRNKTLHTWNFVGPFSMDGFMVVSPPRLLSNDANFHRRVKGQSEEIFCLRFFPLEYVPLPRDSYLKAILIFKFEADPPV